ncbi:MAG TPA: NUDIX hydrolase [Ktedonosporobacter sp.]|nr:NUDIX hydrolase [Ktedonosporobacter sp.]
MITFDKDNLRFSYRIAGVAIRDGKVLVQQPEKGGYYFLPGGRAELQEPARETLRREMQEELHVDVTIGRLLWVVENFFEFGGKEFHELGMYFLMIFPEDSPVYDTSKTFALQEGSHAFVLLWHSLDDLGTVPIYPSFLETALQSLPDGTEHIVHVD